MKTVLFLFLLLYFIWLLFNTLSNIIVLTCYRCVHTRIFKTKEKILDCICFLFCVCDTFYFAIWFISELLFRLLFVNNPLIKRPIPNDRQGAGEKAVSEIRRLAEGRRPAYSSLCQITACHNFTISHFFFDGYPQIWWQLQVVWISLSFFLFYYVRMMRGWDRILWGKDAIKPYVTCRLDYRLIALCIRIEY